MEGIRELLERAREGGLPVGMFRALMHIIIGRKISRSNGTRLSGGITWRELASCLKQSRFDRELVREFGVDPEALAPRDREKFWYAAIAQARVDSADAYAEAELLIPFLGQLGFIVGPSPAIGSVGQKSFSTPQTLDSKISNLDEKPGKGKK